MRLLVQGRLNMDRFYGDMVLEPVAVMAAEQHVRMDNAPESGWSSICIPICPPWTP